MPMPLNVFVTEGNVDIYLSRLHLIWDAADRDRLLRLVVEEESRMGFSRDHVENGEKRVREGRARVERQRDIVALLPVEQRAESQAARLLETLEAAQRLLEGHLAMLNERFARRKL